MVLVTACRASSPREGIDFLPLTVDYREYTYASGRIPGGFFKREGKMSEKETLTSRVIDRPIRPLFPDGWRFETQIIALVLSADAENDTDVLALTGASAALAISAIPFEKTIAGVRVGLVDGQYVINPTFEQRKHSLIDLVVAGSADGLMMVEAGAKQVTEQQVVEALEAAHAAIKQIVATIDDLAKEAGKKKMTVAKKEIAPASTRRSRPRSSARCTEAMRIRGKLENYDRVDHAQEGPRRHLPEGEVQRKVEAKHIFKELKEKVLREEVLTHGVRLDGRKFDEVRPIWIETSVLPRTHGSSVFTRGETQALVTCTLGTADDAQKIETFEGEQWKSFMLHYNFPPFSVGETWPHARTRTPRNRPWSACRAFARADDARRGTVSVHGPGGLGHPRVERLLVDGLGVRRIARDDGCRRAAEGAGGRHRYGPRHGREDGQVRRAERHRRRRGPLRRHGLQGRRHHKRHHRAADGHQGERDHHRRDAQSARAGQARSAAHPRRRCARRSRRPRQNISNFAPRIVTIRIPVDKIRDVIGPGGKMIRSIIERTGVKIDVEDDGRVNVASADGESAAKAISIIQELTATPELNKTYMGKVQRITDFGAFVEIMPGTDGLLHVSEIANHRVKDVRDELKEGEQLMVKVINIDPTGKIRLSRKALLQNGKAPRRRGRLAFTNRSSWPPPHHPRTALTRR